MTREEAIAIIENEKKCVNRANKNDYCNRDCYNCELVKTDIEILTALDMAIRSLSQEPSGDAVSRRAVKEQMIKYGFHAPDMTVTEFVEDLSPINPQEPKAGHWNCGDDMFEYAICSLCKHETGEAWEYAKRNFKYCPNCGARMD